MMEYGYDCSQTFNIKVLAVSDMPRGTWRRCPHILGGKSDIHVIRDGRDVIWDYRDFKLEAVIKIRRLLSPQIYEV